MGIIVNMHEKNKEVSKHIDKEDYITVFFHIRCPTNGGETNYNSGLTSKKLVYYNKNFHASIDI